MSKKTRSEKLTADARRNLYRYEAESQTSQKIVSKVINNTLTGDLRKTALLIAIITAAQIILFLILKNKIIFLPGITY